MSLPAAAEHPPDAFTYFVAMCSLPSVVSMTARTLEYMSMRTRVDSMRSPAPAASPKWKVAATGAGFFSMMSVRVLTSRAMLAGMRIVRGTTAASSAR